MLAGHVGVVLDEMLADQADADASVQAAELLWQVWRCWEAGVRLYVLSEDAAARLTVPAYDAGAWRFAAPPACYVQLPYQRAWGRVAETAAYEPVDGWFVAARDVGDGAHEVSILAMLGLRRDRPGVSLVPHRVVLSDVEVRERIAHPWREGAAPFTNAIPGGELMGYRTLATSSELESLVLRTLHALDTGSQALVRAEGGAGESESRLAHVLLP